jgi:hypothetical protein
MPMEENEPKHILNAMFNEDAANGGGKVIKGTEEGEGRSSIHVVWGAITVLVGVG